MDAVELRFGGNESLGGPACADQLPRKVARLLGRLFRSRRVTLRPLVGLDDEVLGLGLNLLDLADVAVELADVGADEGVTFP